MSFDLECCHFPNEHIKFHINILNVPFWGFHEKKFSSARFAWETFSKARLILSINKLTTPFVVNKRKAVFDYTDNDSNKIVHPQTEYLVK